MKMIQKVGGVVAVSLLTGAVVAANVVSQLSGPRKVDEIIIHCTATPEGVDCSAADIDRWHRRRGFKADRPSESGLQSIGYHYVVRIDGRVETGRDETQPGAHCKGHNARSIGVCYVGGLSATGVPKDTRTPEQREALVCLVEDLRRRYPGAQIYGHCDFAKKSCPCFDARKEFGQ